MRKLWNVLSLVILDSTWSPWLILDVLPLSSASNRFIAPPGEGGFVTLLSCRPPMRPHCVVACQSVQPLRVSNYLPPLPATSVAIVRNGCVAAGNATISYYGHTCQLCNLKKGGGTRCGSISTTLRALTNATPKILRTIP